ncbi:hypothetical protein H6F83_22670 [Coleofasciculus sp. FACHB-125]|uniref:hypothetical protein n=1 Tax=Trichocoleus sp. DQ-A3 TaxID=2933925 RepID=UPI0019885564|nr:hypothetical protein [Coleofasciculus sp. FACHB-125]
MLSHTRTAPAAFHCAGGMFLICHYHSQKISAVTVLATQAIVLVAMQGVSPDRQSYRGW